MPAYEWNFGDVNPPVYAFAAMYAYIAEKNVNEKGDTEFLKAVSQKLLLNFSWWANRKDPQGRNIFEGGFSPSQIPAGGISFCFTNIFMETMAGASAPIIRPAGPGSPRASYRPTTWTRRRLWNRESV